MRIESYSQIQQLYNNSKPVNVNTAQNSVSFKDKLNISNAGKDLQVAKAAVGAVPDVRESKVASLKEAIKNGTYNVSGEEFADKIMDKLSQALA